MTSMAPAPAEPQNAGSVSITPAEQQVPSGRLGAMHLSENNLCFFKFFCIAVRGGSTAAEIIHIRQIQPAANVAGIFWGVNDNKSSSGEGVKVVGVSDFLDYTKPKYAELEQISPEGIVTERNRLRDSEILFVRSNGNRELTGRSLFVEQPPKASSNGSRRWYKNQQSQTGNS